MLVMKIDPLNPPPSYQFSSHRVGWRTLRRTLLLTGLVSPALTPLWAQEGKFTADFEAPSYQPRSIHGQQGWSVEQGVAQVTAAAGRGGSTGLVLSPASPFSQATLLLDAPLAGVGGVPGFLDFHVAPAATEAARSEEMLDIDSARIGFFRLSSKPAEGRFWIFNGNEAAGTVRNEVASSGGWITPNRPMPSSSGEYDRTPVPGITHLAPITRLAPVKR